MQLLELVIDDTSPLILYSPFRDTLSTPDLNNGWNPYYTFSGLASPTGQMGMGESYHITSRASLSVKWNGNGIQLLGNTTFSTFSVTLDGAEVTSNATSLSNNTLVDIFNLQDGLHTLTLTTQMSQNQTPRNSSFAFDKAVIRAIAHGASSEQQPLDSNSVSFHDGPWTVESSSSGQTFRTSTSIGDWVSTSFDGTAFILQGMTSLQAGNYSVTLDGDTTNHSAQSSFIVHNTTLFLATGLDDSAVHSVEVKNLGGSLSLLENGFWAVPGPVQNQPSPPPIAIFGAIFGLIILGRLAVKLGSFLERRRSRQTISRYLKAPEWTDQNDADVPEGPPSYLENPAATEPPSYDTLPLDCPETEGPRSKVGGFWDVDRSPKE